VECGAEAPVDELVGGQHLSLKIFGKEDDGDDDAADHVTEDDLQKPEVAAKCEAGNGNDGERAGLG